MNPNEPGIAYFSWPVWACKFRVGTFDIVHCYGLLYHLESPEAALAAMAEVCTGLLLLETCVSPGPGLLINPVNEIVGDYTQSVNGRACRPTRAWVFETAKRYFAHVYQTRTSRATPSFRPIGQPFHQTMD